MRATEDPDVILFVGRDRRSESHLPLGRNLRPRGILLELREPALADVRSLGGWRLADHGRGEMRDRPGQDDRDREKTDRHALHGLSPCKEHGADQGVQGTNPNTLGTALV